MGATPLLSALGIIGTKTYLNQTKMARLLTILFILTVSTILLESSYVPLNTLEVESVTTTLDVFETGSFSTTLLTVDKSSSARPPRDMLIITPTKVGCYPVIMFHHGTSLPNSFYTQLLNHTSTHGYIVVAPQYYNLIPPLNAWDELNAAAEVANWLQTSLQLVLPGNVEGNLKNLTVAGHSRGGLMAFALALEKSNTPLQVNISALIGVDPVAGLCKNFQVLPGILTYAPHSFNLSIPVTVIGSGLGNVTRILFPCAPNEVNHVEFYSECKAPSADFNVTDYGHMDFLNDDLTGLEGLFADNLCTNGKGSKDTMRRTVGGIMVAFLRAYFGGEYGDYMTILTEPWVAPAKLDPVESYGVFPDYSRV